MKRMSVKLQKIMSVIYTCGLISTYTVCIDDRIASRNYYEALIAQASERRWDVHLLPYFSIAWKGFSDNPNDNSLAAVVWGSNKFAIQDIFLLSRLAHQSLVHIDRAPKTAGNIILPLPLPFQRPIGSTVAFGNYASDQYIALIADTDLLVYMEDTQFGVDFGASHKWKVGDARKMAFEMGINVPIRSVKHFMRIGFDLGKLFNEAFAIDITTREDTLREFYDDFIDVQSFFEQGVLASKSLQFKAVNRDLGLADINIYATADFAGYTKHFDGLQCGLNLIFPSGLSQNLDQLWPIVLGNGGAYQCDLFVNMLMHTRSPLVNPILNVAIQLSAPLYTSYRIAQLVTQNGTSQIQDNPGIADTITRFDPYYVDSFSEYDTAVAQFADFVTRAHTKKGPSVLLSMGNYFYDVFRTRFSIGLLYQYMHKWQDCITVSKSQGVFDIASIREQSRCNSHTVSWNATYKFENYFELSLGSQHVIGGINVAQTHELFGSMVWVF